MISNERYIIKQWSDGSIDVYMKNEEQKKVDQIYEFENLNDMMTYLNEGWLKY